MKIIYRIFLTLGGLMVLVGGLAAVKGLQIGRMVAQGEAFVPPPEMVTAAKVGTYKWESVLKSVGSLEAVQGVVVSAELPGKVIRIGFEPGTEIPAGGLLAQQDVSAESADLRAAKSEVDIAEKEFKRYSRLYPERAVSRSDFDDKKARYEKARAQLDNINAGLAKKTIRAPFSGRLGIRQVNLGENLEPGHPIVSLQSLDPIYVNFLLPQQEMTNLKKGLQVRVTTDAPEGGTYQGTLSAINSEVDHASRNIRLQATLENPGKDLLPGMYVNVEVVLPARKPVLAIPVTAVQYAPYSDSVFVVEAGGKNETGQSRVVRRQFVQLGEQHGDFIVVHSGLNAGDTVVSTGVFKLRNGQSIIVDNSSAPKFQMEPRPDNA